jgi:hypothetical protein
MHNACSCEHIDCSSTYNVPATFSVLSWVFYLSYILMRSKSAIFGLKLSSRSTLCGFRSQWMIPLLWRNRRPRATPKMMLNHVAHSSFSHWKCNETVQIIRAQVQKQSPKRSNSQTWAHITPVVHETTRDFKPNWEQPDRSDST